MPGDLTSCRIRSFGPDGQRQTEIVVPCAGDDTQIGRHDDERVLLYGPDSATVVDPRTGDTESVPIDSQGEDPIPYPSWLNLSGVVRTGDHTFRAISADDGGDLVIGDEIDVDGWTMESASAGTMVLTRRVGAHNPRRGDGYFTEVSVRDAVTGDECGSLRLAAGIWNVDATALDGCRALVSDGPGGNTAYLVGG